MLDRRAVVAAAAMAIFGIAIAMPVHRGDADNNTNQPATASPIKHVIVVIGENRSFDHIFATYRSKSGDSILNPLSEGIIGENGAPGHGFGQTTQYTVSPQPSYYIGAPKSAKTAYSTLPDPTLNGAPNQPSATSPPFTGLSEDQLAAIEPSLEPSDLYLLTTGATGAAGTKGPDTRIANYANLPNGLFQLTGPNLPYDSYTGDTTHRFYQMWQQSDCSVATITRDDPSGCLSDLYPFVITTYAGPTADEGGSNSMAFYNVADGDAPLLKQLADEYTLADNYHQPAQGGTGMQHVFMGTGDDVWWSDGNGNPTVPPASQIANPNPQPGTNNQYTQDVRFSDCSDPTQPGVGPIVDYLSALPKPVGRIATAVTIICSTTPTRAICQMGRSIPTVSLQAARSRRAVSARSATRSMRKAYPGRITAAPIMPLSIWRTARPIPPTRSARRIARSAISSPMRHRSWPTWPSAPLTSRTQ